MAIIAQQPVGAAGYLIIDDHDGHIRFYLRQDFSSTFIGSPGKDWWGVVNGVSVGGKWTWASGGGTRLLAGPWHVGYSQTVSFSIGPTGTSGFGSGGGTSAWVSRATVPPPPANVGLDQITQTSMRYRFSSTGDGGSPVLEWQIVRARDANFSQEVVFTSSSGTSVITGLTPGTRYWFASRGRNALGWGSYSAPLNAMTLPSGARVGKGGAFVNAETNVGKGSAFATTQILIGKGGSFVPPA